MISLKEILMGRAEFISLPKDVQSNLMILLERINKIRSAYGKPMRVNDGIRIKGLNDYGAKSSNHYLGAAIDIDDDDSGTLWKWLMLEENMQLLKNVGLWLEHGNYTHHKNGTWVHFQIVAPKSGRRIFIPSTQPDPNPSFWSGKYDKKFD